MSKNRFMMAALCGVALFSSSVKAAETVFDGFYMGAKVTGESSKYKVKNAAAEFDGLGAHSMGAGLFGGWRTVTDTFCLGGELSVRGAWDKAEFKMGTDKGTLKRDYVLGLHFVPGVLLTPNLLGAVKLGVEYTQYKLADTKKKKTAFNVGVLFEMPVADSLALRAEASYTPPVKVVGETKASHQSFGAGLVYKI